MEIYEQLEGYLEDGYEIYFGSYYGDNIRIEDLQDLAWAYKDSVSDSHYIASIDVYDEYNSVYVYVGDNK